MTLHFLGTGTSTGVPQIGCTCEVCTSADTRDQRLRTSALLETDDGTRLLLDCTPDFRQQMLGLSFRPLDAILVTHEHYDHVGGLDDLRPFSVFGDVKIYAEAYCVQHLRERLPYCFVEHKYPGVPQLLLQTITPGEYFRVNKVDILPIRVKHGRLPIVGFRIGNLAYITDMLTIAPDDLNLLRGVSTLVVNALRFSEHGSHQTVGDALKMIEEIAPERAYLIHMSHHIGLHSKVAASLPSGVYLTYDGLEIDC